MNKISLDDFTKNLTSVEREIVDNEKKYYHLIVSLKKKREHLGLTQEQLAKLSKIPRTTITRIESGSRNATIQTIMTLAQAMGNKIELKLI